MTVILNGFDVTLNEFDVTLNEFDVTLNGVKGLRLRVRFGGDTVRAVMLTKEVT